MNLMGVELAKLNELFNFGDDVIGSGHYNIRTVRRSMRFSYLGP